MALTTSRGKLAVLLAGAALVLAGCGSGPLASGSKPHPAATVNCGLISCSHGRVGQPCTIAGHPGIVVQTSATALGCDPRPGGGSPAAPTALPQPSPVSTAANLTGNCVMGYEWVPNTTNAATGNFVPGLPPGSHGQPYPPGTSPDSGDATLAYRVTLTNASASTADVTGFAVAFYLISGSEAGSDRAQFGDAFITAGQSLAWTVIEDHTILGYGDDPNQQLAQTSNIPGGVASCQFLQWYTGSGQ